MVLVNQNVQIRNIWANATKDVGNDDTIIVKAPEGKKKEGILNELRNAGISLQLRVEKKVLTRTNNCWKTNWNN